MFPTVAIDTDSEDIWGSCIHDATSHDDPIPDASTEPCSKCGEVLYFEYVPHASLLTAFNEIYSPPLQSFAGQKYQSRPDGQAESWGSTPLGIRRMPNQWGALGMPFNAVLFHDRNITLELGKGTGTPIQILRRHMNNPTDVFRNWLYRFTKATTFWPFHKVYQTKEVNGIMYRRLIQTLDWTWEDIQTLFRDAEDPEWEHYEPDMLFPYIGNYKLLRNFYGDPQTINYKHIK